MENKKEKFVEKNKKQIIIVALALVLLLGGTYAWLQLTLTGTKTTRIEAGTLALEIAEGNEISLTEALPITDEEGLATDAYTFTLNNTGNVTSEYAIYLDDVTTDENSEEILTTERMADSVIRYNLTTDETNKTDTLSVTQTESGRLLAQGSIAAGDTITYNLRLWINEDATESDIHVLDEAGSFVKGKVFAGKLRIEANQVKE